MFTINFIPSKTKYRLDADKWLRIVGTKAVNNITKAMRETPKTGTRYRRGRRFHIASSPGNAPAIDTGFLVRSMTAEVALNVLIVTNSASYASYVNQGTKNMAARPFMEVNILKALEEVPALGILTRK